MCDFTHCVSGKPGTIGVNENVGDGAYRTMICAPCAKVVGLKDGDDIPHDAEAVNQKLKASRKCQA